MYLSPHSIHHCHCWHFFAALPALSALQSPSDPKWKSNSMPKPEPKCQPKPESLKQPSACCSTQLHSARFVLSFIFSAAHCSAAQEKKRDNKSNIQAIYHILNIYVLFHQMASFHVSANGYSISIKCKKIYPCCKLNKTNLFNYLVNCFIQNI